MGAVPDAANGLATAAYFREPFWHKLGTVVADEVTDYLKFLDLANMSGQNIRKVALPEIAGIPAERHAREVVAIVRTNPLTGLDEVLGLASPEYEVIQPEEILSWAQFGPTDGMRWETVFQMKGGTQIAASIAMERETVLDPNGVADVTKWYMMVASSYDGSLANRGGRTAVRVGCENTLDVALGDISQSFSFRSTKNVRERIKKWQQEVATTHEYIDQFEVEAQALLAKPITKATFFEKIVPAMYPKPEKDVKGALKKWDTRIENIASLWNGPTNAGLPDSAWKAWNVLTEHNQWQRAIRSENVENFALAGAGFDGAATKGRAEALEVVRAFA